VRCRDVVITKDAAYKVVVTRRDEDDGEFLQTTEILDELGVNNITVEDCRNVRKICKSVSERAAFLASAGMSHNKDYI